MELQEIEVKKDYIEKIVKNNKYNESVVLSYYDRLRSENNYLIDEYLNLYNSSDDPFVEQFAIQRLKVLRQTNFNNKISSVASCNSKWLLDVYREAKIKDFKKTNLCKDKFCNNCKKVKQASRMAKFIPQIENIRKDYNLYLLTLTVPNCNGTNLDFTIKKIFKAFYSLNRYLKLDIKIKGLDFSQYGYSGSLRSLEVTFKNDSYHPHIHAVIALDKNFDNFKSIEDNNSFHINSYSYNNKFENGCYSRELTRVFSDFEVLIQKIWYLLINNLKVTLNAIEGLSEGYSCTLDSISESSYYEVFKYMTKATDEKHNVLTYDNFKTLFFALYRVRQIQGYGVFYNIKDDDSLLEEFESMYDDLINELQSKEDPEEVSEAPQDLYKDNEYLLISRKKRYSYLKKIIDK